MQLRIHVRVFHKPPAKYSDTPNHHMTVQRREWWIDTPEVHRNIIANRWHASHLKVVFSKASYFEKESEDVLRICWISEYT